MMNKTKHPNQWFKQAGLHIGGSWQYLGEPGTRAHQLMMIYGETTLDHSTDVDLIWHDAPITASALKKLWKQAKDKTIIAGYGYGVNKNTDISKVIDEFAQSKKVNVQHNCEEPAIWWIHKERSDESTDHTVDEIIPQEHDTTDVSGSTLPGTE